MVTLLTRHASLPDQLGVEESNVTPRSCRAFIGLMTSLLTRKDRSLVAISFRLTRVRRILFKSPIEAHQSPMAVKNYVQTVNGGCQWQIGMLAEPISCVSSAYT